MANTDLIDNFRLFVDNTADPAIEKQQLNSFKTYEKYKYYHD